ncbi:MAG: hypothetical protein NW220_20385 [Leptolyngbyaceae cyanobacterium bins.349]|nr:hypothetical protein [Leptolyngbyaceae cyanobacterium bins.349]
MFLNLTRQDLLILENQRLIRFQSLFDDTLPFCALRLDRDNDLEIHCSEPWVIDLLLCAIEELCWAAWIVLGSYQMTLYYAQEEIYTATTHSLIQRSQPSYDYPIAS